MKCIQQGLHESGSEDAFGDKGVCFLFLGRKRVEHFSGSVHDLRLLVELYQ